MIARPFGPRRSFMQLRLAWPNLPFSNTSHSLSCCFWTLPNTLPEHPPP